MTSEDLETPTVSALVTQCKRHLTVIGWINCHKLSNDIRKGNYQGDQGPMNNADSFAQFAAGK